MAHSPPAPSTKPTGYDFYTNVLGSPKLVVAPMVEQSELAWRVLSRRYGADLVYTPMIHAKLYAVNERKPFREQNFSIQHGEEGSSSVSHPLSVGRPLDRPLIVQLCGNDPDHILTTAKILAPHCDAIDLNLGCPQDIAKKGKYGAFLQDDWELIHRIISTLHRELPVPVTAKFRVFPSLEKTVEYARMLERAGAQILTCHGRTREQRGQRTGLADWAKIRAVKAAVSVPVFANGNIAVHADIKRCLEATGADAVMSAEGQLYNAALFAPSDPSLGNDETLSTFPASVQQGLHLPHADLALEYLSIVEGLQTRTSLGSVKGHLFKLMRPALVRETDLRERLGKIRGADSFEAYKAVVLEMKTRMDRDADAAARAASVRSTIADESLWASPLPHWLAQPYYRPGGISKDEEARGSKTCDELDTESNMPVETCVERVFPALPAA